MGKAAENEKRKLRATRLNSLSVGLFIAGFFVPYTAFLAKLLGHLNWFDVGTAEDIRNATFVLGAGFLSVWASRVYFRRALTILDTIED